MKRLLQIGLCIAGLSILACDAPTAPQEAPAVAEKAVEKHKKVAPVEILPKDDIGIGPITSITLEAIDPALVAKGKEAFKAKCTACHKMKKRYIGPGLAEVTDRRRPEWIMNMIMNPMEMVEKNAAARKLLMEYNAPMANQNISEADARAILEYFRQASLDKKESASE